MKSICLLILSIVCLSLWQIGCDKPSTTSDSKQSPPETVQQTLYVCPMHPEITANKPDKCSKCGMPLEIKKASAYVCPMHPEITSDKPDKCSKCGMALVKK